MSEKDPLAALQAENARLIALLEAHGIEWRLSRESQPGETREHATGALSTSEKVALFRRLFRGRVDVYPVRWESTKTGKSGYVPACANEWCPGVCEKPRVKCADCSHRQLLPVTDAVIYAHLAGEHTVGVYPLLSDDTCHFLAVDFDEAEWRSDVVAFARSCRELEVPVTLEISRSGKGAHAWLFFAEALPACDARRLGAATISHTCARTRQLKLTSYDRLFPNQDTMPKGGFGKTLVAASIIARRGINTLVLAHRTELLEQWREHWSAPERTGEFKQKHQTKSGPAAVRSWTCAFISFWRTGLTPPARLRLIVGGAGIDPAFALRGILLFPERRPGLEVVDNELTGTKRLAPMAAGGQDEHDGVRGLQFPYPVHHSHRRQVPTPAGLIHDGLQGLLGHTGIVFQVHAGHRIALVDIPHQAQKTDHRPHLGVGAT